MVLLVYSDESGVLDKVHNDYYTFGGVVFTSGDDRDEYCRRYLAAERNIRISENIPRDGEVKACNITPKSKNKLFRALKSAECFGVIVDQKRLTNDSLFENKKSKQRYLDWVYTAGVKSKVMDMIRRGVIEPEEVEAVHFFADEHSTATNGWYELREILEKEFKIGQWNYDDMSFREPLFPNVGSVNLQYCNSTKNTLIRGADIVANRVYYFANRVGSVPADEGIHIFRHP